MIVIFNKAEDIKKPVLDNDERADEETKLLIANLETKNQKLEYVFH
jgi:hypothetical protein